MKTPVKAMAHFGITGEQREERQGRGFQTSGLSARVAIGRLQVPFLCLHGTTAANSPEPPFGPVWDVFVQESWTPKELLFFLPPLGCSPFQSCETTWWVSLSMGLSFCRGWGRV